MVYNPARNILAKRQQQESSDPALVDANMSSVSAALDVHTHEVCPKCGNKTVPAKLANGDPVAFCQVCSVSIPVPLGS